MKLHRIILTLAGVVLVAPAEAATLLQYNFDTTTPEAKLFTDNSGNGRDLTTNRALDIKDDNPFTSARPDLVGIDKSLYNHYPYTTATSGYSFNVSDINLNTTNSFTIEGWVKPVGADYGNGGTVLSLSSNVGGSSNFTIGYNAAGNAYGIFNSLSQAGGGDNIDTGAKLTLGEWNHLAMVFNTNNDYTIRIYLNGVEVATQIRGRALPTALSSLSVLTGGGLGQVQGYVDDIRLSDVALAPSELGYHAPFTTAIPEPSSAFLLLAGGLYFVKRKQLKTA